MCVTRGSSACVLCECFSCVCALQHGHYTHERIKYSQNKYTYTHTHCTVAHSLRAHLRERAPTATNGSRRWHVAVVIVVVGASRKIYKCHSLLQHPRLIRGGFVLYARTPTHTDTHLIAAFCYCLVCVCVCVFFTECRKRKLECVCMCVGSNVISA